MLFDLFGPSPDSPGSAYQLRGRTTESGALELSWRLLFFKENDVQHDEPQNNSAVVLYRRRKHRELNSRSRSTQGATNSVNTMAKKRVYSQSHHKPATTTHPSLTRSALLIPSNKLSTGTSSSGSLSVNEQLSHLRRTQGAVSSSDDGDDGISSSIWAQSRPRNDLVLRTGHRGNRLPPGPAAPPSWSDTCSIPAQLEQAYLATCRERPDRIDHLPGLPDLAAKGSLLDMTFKSMATYWDWHTHYDQYHLATLPGNLKSLLLSYIAAYGPGISIEGLSTLFAKDRDVPGATSTEDVTRLDLAYSVTRSISLEQLQRYLTEPSTAIASAAEKHNSSHISCQDNEEMEEASRESHADKLPLRILPIMRFPRLTHLSLANPLPTASWSALLFLTQQIPTITHLSLAYWPTPTLPSASAIQTSPLNASTVSPRSSPLINDTFGLHDWSEAGMILRRLSKATYCLHWLSLEGCHDWFDALCQPKGPEWTGAWQGLKTLILRDRHEAAQSTRPSFQNSRSLNPSFSFPLSFSHDITTSEVVTLSDRSIPPRQQQPSWNASPGISIGDSSHKGLPASNSESIIIHRELKVWRFLHTIRDQARLPRVAITRAEREAQQNP